MLAADECAPSASRQASRLPRVRQEAIFGADVVNFSTVDPIETPVRWLDLSEDVRRQVKAGYPTRRLASAEARAAVSWARQRRRVLDRAAFAAAAVASLAALWTIVALVATSVRGALAPSTTTVVGVAVAALALGAWAVCVTNRHAAIRVEAAYLADALPLTGSPTGAESSTSTVARTAPASVNWRHSRAFRAARASLAAALAVAVDVAVIWLAARHRPAADVVPVVVVQVATLAYVVGRWAYGWPWPLASSYPHLATLDGHEMRIHPLGLTVPWHRVTRVRFGVANTGVAVLWHVDDPAAVVADAPVSPAQQRRLLRWLYANGSAIRLTESQMLEAPESVYASAEAIRNGRLSAFRISVPLPSQSSTTGDDR
jgi:hypothetical protein